MEATSRWLVGRTELEVRATFLGQRLAAHPARARRHSNEPAFREHAGGRVLLYPYGVVVVIGVSEEAESELMSELRESIRDPFERPAQDEVDVVLVSKAEPLIDPEGTVQLAELDEDRLVLVSDVLAKSVVLDHFEQTIDQVYEQLEPLAAMLSAEGRLPRGKRDLVRLIGHALSVRQKTVWKVEVEEKPDLVWDRPELEPLYLRLSAEYELAERHRALAHKLELLSETASTLRDMLNDRHFLRVEWYIALLIVFEVVLSLYDLWRG